MAISSLPPKLPRTSTVPRVTSRCKPFTTTSSLLRKGAKQVREQQQQQQQLKSSSTSAAEDPSDLSGLEAGIGAVLEQLIAELSKLRAGGRFNPQLIEDLRVQLSNKGRKESARLGDLAQVVPRGGRMVGVIVGEEDVSFGNRPSGAPFNPTDGSILRFPAAPLQRAWTSVDSSPQHVKPITTALLSSPYSLNPNASAAPSTNGPPGGQSPNPLEILVPLPPPTQESRQQALDAATKAGETAQQAVRQARGAQQKKLRAMQLARTARPDDLRRAGEKMEKVVRERGKEVERVVEGWKKGAAG